MTGGVGDRGGWCRGKPPGGSMVWGAVGVGGSYISESHRVRNHGSDWSINHGGLIRCQDE